MKKFLISLGTAILLVLLVGGAILFSMASIHGHSVKDEFYKWFPALEREVETEDSSEEDDIVVEEETETQTEETGDEI